MKTQIAARVWDGKTMHYTTTPNSSLELYHNGYWVYRIGGEETATGNTPIMLSLDQTDAVGHPIYHHDIVSRKIGSKNLHLIVFEQGRFHEHDTGTLYSNSWVVEGNVYENPELKQQFRRPEDGVFLH